MEIRMANLPGSGQPPGDPLYLLEILAYILYHPEISKTTVVIFAVMTDLIANSETQLGLYGRPLAVHQQEWGWRPPPNADMKPSGTRNFVHQLPPKG